MGYYKNTLKVINNMNYIQGILMEAVTQRDTVYLWKMINGEKVYTEVKIHKVNRNELFFILYFTQENEADLERIVGGNSTIKLYFPRFFIFIETSVIHFLGNNLIMVKFPNIAKQVDRRKNRRVLLREDLEHNVSFSKDVATYKGDRSQYFNKKIFDIAEGGLSIIVNKTEAKYFNLGDKIKTLQLKLDGMTLVTNVTVVKLAPLDNHRFDEFLYKVWKVSIKFDNLSKNDKDYLLLFLVNYLQTDFPYQDHFL